MNRFFLPMTFCWILLFAGCSKQPQTPAKPSEEVAQAGEKAAQAAGEAARKAAEEAKQAAASAKENSSEQAPQPKYRKPRPIHICVKEIETGITTADDLIACIGRKPNSYHSAPDGTYLLQWMRFTPNGGYHLSVEFNASYNTVERVQGFTVI